MNNKISKTYLVTDSHFGHCIKMMEYCDRPSNYEQLIINNWKSTVQPQDIVIDLGDVCFSNKEQLEPIIKDLPGTKILIRGNHDRSKSNNWFLKVGYSFVCKKIEISRVILSHFPAILNEKEIELGIINIHGHFHNIKRRKWEDRYKNKLTDNHYLLSPEYVGYKPILLEAAKNKKFVIKTNEVEY